MKKTDLFEIVPIGGVGQIGHNMTLIGDEESSFLIDGGILFPYEDAFNIRYLIPDMTDIPHCENIVITHGHEDHIGAIFHVLERFPKITIWAPPFAAALIKSKLDYLKVSYKLKTFKESDEITIGNFKVNPVHVNHSIPDTYGMLVERGDACFFLASDFKSDKKTPYERPIDFKKLRLLSKDKKFKLLLPDSTNITSGNKRTISEADLIGPIESIFNEAKGRVFVTCFASNIHRIQTIINASEKSGRKVILYGSSMKNYVEIAHKLGLITFKEKTLVDVAAADEYKKKLTVVVSGCQADFRSAFRRVAWGEDSNFQLGKSDTFLLSSKAIPGNEKKIGLSLNKISETKCRIITDRDDLIHASGHAGKDDLLDLYEAFEPTHIIPIHGESFFLERHVEYINDIYPQAKARLIHNFTKVAITDQMDIRLAEHEPVQPIIIHGKQKVIEREVISERRKCSENGVIFFSVKTESLLKNKLNFQMSYQGLPHFFTTLVEDINTVSTDTLRNRKIKTLEDKEKELKIVVRRIVNNALGYKPQVLVHFI